jgi:uncharacterized protein YcbX
MWVEVGRVSQVWVYPLKSAAGCALEGTSGGEREVEVERRGLRGDRRWMLVDGEGRMLSQRALPAMARLAARPWGAGERGLHVVSWRRGGEWGGEMEVEAPTSGEPVEVEVWGDRVQALAAPEVASAWLAGELGARCALVYLPDAVTRPVDARYGEAGDEVSFADGFPLLVVSQGSLDDLAERAGEQALGDARRVRPNLVIEGCAPYAEDRWARVRVGGEVELALVKPCGRCAMVNVDPQTGEVGREPLATLAGYRRGEDGKVTLGQNATPRRLGRVRVGDTVAAWIGI